MIAAAAKFEVEVKLSDIGCAFPGLPLATVYTWLDFVAMDPRGSGVKAVSQGRTSSRP